MLNAALKRASQPRKPITRGQLRLALALQATAHVGALGLLALCPHGTLEAMGLIAVAWALGMALLVDAREGRLGPRHSPKPDNGSP